MESGNQAEIVYLIIVGSISIVILILGVVSIVILFQKKMLRNYRDKKETEAQHQKSLLRGFIETQEKERKRIAADLHDEISASLAAAKMLLNQKEISTESIHEIKNVIEKTANRAREISHNIMPPSLETLGLAKVLERFYNSIDSETLTVDYEFNPNVKLNEKQQLALYRICQELTNNTLKYANANQIVVKFIASEGQIEFHYSDNGVGFDPKNTSGMGLNNIESRAQSINAEINFFSNPASSTGIKMVLKNDGKNQHRNSR